MNLKKSHKKNLLQKSIWLFSGRGLPVIVLFIITILYSGKLSYADYGKFQSVWMYTNIVSIIISYGFSSVIFSTNLAFLFSFLKKNKKPVILFYTALWLIALLIFFLIAKNFTVLEKLLIIFFIIVQNVITIYESLLIKRGGEKISFIINIFYSLLFLGIHVLILQAAYSLLYLVAWISLISVVKLIAIFLVPSKQTSAEIISAEQNFVHHWNYLGLNEILGVISRWIDKLFLLYLLTASDFAVFFNGSFEIPLFGLIISVAGSLMLIEFSTDTADRGTIIKLFRETFNLLSSFVFPLFFFLFFFRRELFAFAFGNKYNDSVRIFAISIFVILIRINNYSSILQTFTQGKKIMIGSVIDIVIALMLMVILYPFMGSKGIALSMVISTYCQVAYYLFHSAKVLKMSISQLVPLKNLITKFLILALAYFALFVALQDSSISFKLITVMVFSMVATVVAAWNYITAFFKKSYV